MITKLKHFTKGHKGIIRMAYTMAVILSMVTLMAFALHDDKENFEPPMRAVAVRDSLASVTAFKKVYSVLMSPRCMNCHPSGDIPLQGDDSHLHTMNPQRGIEGKGVFAMKCANCHQPENTPGKNTPPGNPNWHLPPANMKMVFQGKTPYQLAKQLVNPKQNGNKDMKKLLEHADDGLVLAGWNPGEGRTLPPISHAEFKKAWTTWINTGAYAPRK